MQIYHSKLENASIEYVIFGHIGENHLHVNMLPNNENEFNRAKNLYVELAQDAVSLGGTVSGEHGIGKLKKSLLEIMYRPEDLLEMKKLKKAFDPQMLLNLGNLF